MPDLNDLATGDRGDSPIHFRAGAAKVCITPNEPLWLAGYASRTAPASGKLSDLYASALALEDAHGRRFVIVSIDLIAVTPTISGPAMEAVRQMFGLEREQLLLTATHTHYAPEFRPDKAVFFKIPEEYSAKLPRVADDIIAAIVQAIELGIEALEPARLFVRTTTVSFAHNRRRYGVVAGTPSSEDIVDHDVPLLDCVGKSGKRIAIVFGYACHNTTIPPEDGRYCGDWAGFAKEHIERLFPETTALFLPGAGADQNPEPSGSVELSLQHGREMAAAAELALCEPGFEITGSIYSVWTDVLLPLERTTPESIRAMRASNDQPQLVKAQFLHDSIARGETLITEYAAPVQVVRFGNELLLIALSGEPVVGWSRELKQELRNDYSVSSATHGAPVVWVAGYCNDMFGYLPTRRVQAEGGYEGGRANLWSWIPAPFTDDVEERIGRAVRRLVEQVKIEE
jgi:hypothetical protein